MFVFFAYVLIAVLFFKLRALSSSLEQTESRLRDEADRREILAHQLARLLRVHTPVPPPAPAPPEPTPVAVTEPISIPIQPAPRVAVKEPVTPTAPLKESSHAPPATSEMFSKMAVATGGWEQLIGGNLLNKAGALVLVIGIALFLSYSFANMGPAGRAFTSLGISGTLLAGGVALERKERYRIFSRGILAAGWAALYFTSYAMHALPAARIIESPVLGTSLMLAVAAGMVLHSLRYRIQSLTALSYGCIFAALALSSLNTFVAISLLPLAVSMLYLARRFEWHAMAVFAAVATYGVFLTRPATGAPLASIQAMLVIFWVLFEAFDLLRIRARADATTLHHALFGINALAGVGASATLWYRMAPDSMWQFSAGAALLYLASTWIRFSLKGDTCYEFSLLISSALTGLAIFARVPELWISVGMMMEAEVLFLAAWRLRARFAKVLSWLAFLAAGRQILDTFLSAQDTGIIWNLSVNNATPPLLILAGLFYLNRYLSKQESYWSYFASAFLTFVIAVETREFVLLGTAWLAFAAVLFEFGLRKSLGEFRYQAYGIAALGAASTTLATFENSQIVPVWTYAAGALYFFGQAMRATQWLPALPGWEQRALRLGGSSGASLLIGFLVHRVTPAPYEALALAAASVLLLELAFRGKPAELLRPALLMNATALLRLVLTHADDIHKQPETAAWISFAGIALTYYWLAVRFLRSTGQRQILARLCSALLASLLGLTTLWMVLPNVWVPVAFAALAAITVELGLLFNASDVIFLGRGLSGLSILALIADAPTDLWPRVAVSFAVAAYQFLMHFRARPTPLAFLHGCVAAVTIAATLFNEVSGGMLTLSLSLEGIVLLVAGFAVRDRWLRLPGLALLLLCIGKVFFYDLRNLDTIYRILSFIGLGLILLGVSWIYTRFKEQLQKLL